MRARIAVLVSLAAMLALAGCVAETEPATNITSTGGQLNAKGKCTDAAGESGFYKWQTRAQRGESDWVDQSPWLTYSCDGPGDFVALSRQASGLQTGVQHFFRILADPGAQGGTTVTIDRDADDNGTDGGTDYDQFTPGP